MRNLHTVGVLISTPSSFCMAPSSALPCDHPLAALLRDDAESSGQHVGVLDLRRGDHQSAYIRGALRVTTGMFGLDQRYSWLPPPVRTSSNGRRSASRRLVVLCDEDERAWAQRKLCAMWDVAGIVTPSDDGSDCAPFWSSARSAGVVEERREAVTALLFEPSAMARLVVAQLTSRKHATLLDLGCGAGRDLAWIVRQADAGSAWRVSGIDNVQAIVRRARLLAEEMHVDAKQVSTSTSAIESIVWARATADGALEALPLADTDDDATIIDQNAAERLSAFAKSHLPHTTYDVILLVRFWPFAMLCNLPALTHVGSLIALSHFTTIVESDVLHDADDAQADYEGPQEDRRFHATHVQELIDVWRSASSQWSVVEHFVRPCEDGRPLRNVIFRRDA